MWYCHLHNVQDVLSDGKLHTNGDSENHLLGQINLSDQRLNIFRCRQKIRRGTTSLARSFSAMFMGCASYAVRHWEKETSSLLQIADGFISSVALDQHSTTVLYSKEVSLQEEFESDRGCSRVTLRPWILSTFRCLLLVLKQANQENFSTD